jgi:hypothetical protein
MLRACRMKAQHYSVKDSPHSLSQSGFLLLRSCLSRVISLGYLFSWFTPQNLSNHRPALLPLKLAHVPHLSNPIIGSRLTFYTL